MSEVKPESQDCGSEPGSGLMGYTARHGCNAGTLNIAMGGGRKAGMHLGSGKFSSQAKTTKGFILDHALSARGSGIFKTSRLPLKQKHRDEVGGRGECFL